MHTCTSNIVIYSSMPGYVAAALHTYQHKTAHRQQHSPHKWERLRYGGKQQMTRELDTSPLLPKEENPHPKHCGHINILLKVGRPHNSGILGINC